MVTCGPTLLAWAAPCWRPIGRTTARLPSKVSMIIRFTTSHFESDRPVRPIADLLFAAKRRRPGLPYPRIWRVPVVGVVTVDGAPYPLTSLSCSRIRGNSRRARFVRVPASMRPSGLEKPNCPNLFRVQGECEWNLVHGQRAPRTAGELIALQTNTRRDGPTGPGHA